MEVTLGLMLLVDPDIFSPKDDVIFDDAVFSVSDSSIFPRCFELFSNRAAAAVARI